MSLKSIELQIAIPKTFEAGKLAEQKNQQSMLNQHNSAALTDQQVQKQRHTVIETAESEKAKEQEGSPGKGHSGNTDREKQQQDKDETHVSHPYKGGFVDYTG